MLAKPSNAKKSATSTIGKSLSVSSVTSIKPTSDELKLWMMASPKDTS